MLWKMGDDFGPVTLVFGNGAELSKNKPSKMRTKVYRVSCVAGIPLNRASETPVKTATVYLQDGVRRKSPSPEGKAQMSAHEVLKLEIANDPKFAVCHWVTEPTEADLSEYATPNLVSSDGSKVWRG
jgi:hypothetical protein